MISSVASGRPVRIAFVCEPSYTDRLGWSGTNYHMASALARQGCELTDVSDFGVEMPFIARLLRSFCRRIEGRDFDITWHRATLRRKARAIRRKIRPGSVDAVFAPGSMNLCFWPGPEAMFFWADATVPRLFRTYNYYSRFSRRLLPHATTCEKSAIRRAAHAFFSSDWATDSAIDDLGSPKEKVGTVCYGANLDDAPSRDEVAASIASRARAPLRILLCGVDWHRKGGDKAVQIVECLNNRGVVSTLVLLGFTEHPPLPRFVENQGRIAKKELEGRRKIRDLFLTSHLLLLPSIEDCTPIVIPEANACGLPVLTHAIGGIGSQVRKGRNGIAFESSASPEIMADWIASLMASEERYRSACLDAHREFESRLNWDFAGGQVVASMQDALAAHSRWRATHG